MRMNFVPKRLAALAMLLAVIGPAYAQDKSDKKTASIRTL